MEVGQVYEKSGRVNQTWSELAPLVQAHCEHCNDLLSSMLLHGHASPTPPRLLRLQCLTFSAQAPTCSVFFFNRGFQCARLDPFSDGNSFFFDMNSGSFVHPGKWPNSCCNDLSRHRYPRCQLALIVVLGGVRHDLRDCQVCLSLLLTPNRQRQLVCRLMFASGQSMHQFQNSFLTFTTVLLDHAGQKPLVFFSEDSLIVLLFTC